MQRGACIILQRQFYANIMFMGCCLTHNNITFNVNRVTKLIKICMQFISYIMKNEIVESDGFSYYLIEYDILIQNIYSVTIKT